MDVSCPPLDPSQHHHNTPTTPQRAATSVCTPPNLCSAHSSPSPHHPPPTLNPPNLRPQPLSPPPPPHTHLLHHLPGAAGAPSRSPPQSESAPPPAMCLTVGGRGGVAAAQLSSSAAACGLLKGSARPLCNLKPSSHTCAPPPCIRLTPPRTSSHPLQLPSLPVHSFQGLPCTSTCTTTTTTTNSSRSHRHSSSRVMTGQGVKGDDSRAAMVVQCCHGGAASQLHLRVCTGCEGTLWYVWGGGRQVVVVPAVHLKQ